ncbi:MAG: signal peptide peptidase SppA [Candidatus Bilamarchaeaceae archaeon]
MASNPSQKQKANPADKGRDYPLIIFCGVSLLVIILVALVFAAGTAKLPMVGNKCVAVMEISGEITTTETPPTLFSEGMLGSEQVADRIRSLNGRSDVGSVVFIINSPGGSTVASREIYRAMKDLQKPKVAYFREVAASGGYYIATPSDYIISEPDALTGSIGVVMYLEDFQGLMDKLGVNMTVVKTGSMKDIGSPFRHSSPEEMALLDALVNQSLDDFKSVIISNRGKKLDMGLFNQALDARVLTGMQAKQAGLVDAVGSRQDAISKAGELAGIGPEPEICKVSMSYGGGSLFDAKSFIRSLQETAPQGLQFR